MRIETGLLAVFLALGQGVDGFQQHITGHSWLSKAAFAVDYPRHESSIPLLHVSGKYLQLLKSSSSTIEGRDSESETMPESDPPFPDTSSLNEKLAELSQSNKESAAIEANHIIEKCESWYQDQVECGIEILPCSQDFIPSMSEVGESGDKTRIGPVPDRHSYSFLINAWANIGRVDDAVATLERMYELSNEGDRITKPNTIVYNSVINAFCSRPEKMGRSGETDGISTPERAECLLRQMIKDYYEGSNEFCFPDTTTYNTVLKVWASSGREDAGENAIRLLKEMWNEQSKFQKANSVNEEDPGDKEELEETEGGKILEITPDQYSYTTTISALARSGNSTAARCGEKLLEEMEERYQDGYTELSPTTYSVNAVLNAWAKTKARGAADRAETILRRMEELCISGERVEVCPDTVSYNIAIHAHARSHEEGSAKRAEDLLRRMDDLSTSYEYKDMFSDCKPDIISYSGVINAWSRSKKYYAAERAESILLHMERQYSAGLSAIAPNIVTYTSAINAWANSKQKNSAERAEALLNRMDSHYREGNEALKPTVLTYNTVCNAWAKSKTEGAADRALEIVNRMETLHFKGEQYCKPDIYSYTTCIDALAKRGTKKDAKKAEELLELLEQKYSESHDTDIKPNVRTYTTVIKSISRSQLGPERAEAILKRMELRWDQENDNDLKADVVCFNAVLNAWGWSNEAEKVKKSQQLFARMIELYTSGENTDAKPDQITFNTLLNACAFADTSDEKYQNEVLDIAIQTFDLFQSSAPVYGKPDHLTYGTMVMIFNKHVPSRELRNQLSKNIFYQCCQNGQLSGFVVSQLQKALSNKLLKELFGEAAIFNGAKAVRIDKRKVPREWNKNGGGIKSKSSKKRSSATVTKQQVRRTLPDSYARLIKE